MGESANKAIMFAVSIFITLIIISGIITIFSQMQEIYKKVDSTDTTIGTRFGSFASYDNTKLTGLEVINCANKYYNKDLVVVTYNGIQVNTESGVAYLDEQYNNGNLKYEDLYNSIVENVEYDGVTKTKISFTKV